MKELKVAYIVRLNGKGRGSIEYLTPEDIESESVLCGDCLRSDCIHLEEARA